MCRTGLRPSGHNRTVSRDSNLPPKKAVKGAPQQKDGRTRTRSRRRAGYLSREPFGGSPALHRQGGWSSTFPIARRPMLDFFLTKITFDALTSMRLPPLTAKSLEKCRPSTSGTPFQKQAVSYLAHVKAKKSKKFQSYFIMFPSAIYGPCYFARVFTKFCF